MTDTERLQEIISARVETIFQGSALEVTLSDSNIVPVEKYKSWIKSWACACLRVPDRWNDWLSQLGDQPDHVVYSLLTDVYRVVSNYLLEEAPPKDLSRGFLLLNQIASYLVLNRESKGVICLNA